MARIAVRKPLQSGVPIKIAAFYNFYEPLFVAQNCQFI